MSTPQPPIRRRARVQVDRDYRPRRAEPQTGTVYNIWYNKWAGGDSWGNTRVKPETRVDIERDSGETIGERSAEPYFCNLFARGCCPHGYHCRFLHRIPNDNDRIEKTRDCFGRELFGNMRDDMGGVGSFMRDRTTLYIGRITTTENLEEVVYRHFSPFGKITRLRVLPGKGVAFVTYSNRLNAEFAKEAMSDQSLDNNEMINVRWATEDPNPRAQAEAKHAAERLAAAQIARMEQQWEQTYNATIQQPPLLQNEPKPAIEYTQDQPESKRPRLEDVPQDNTIEEENTTHNVDMVETDTIQPIVETDTVETTETTPPAPTHLISQDALEAIRAVATATPGIRLCTTTTTDNNNNDNTSTSNSTHGLGLLAEYDSSDED